jgi:hypothetical protein
MRTQGKIQKYTFSLLALLYSILLVISVIPFSNPHQSTHTIKMNSSLKYIYAVTAPSVSSTAVKIPSPSSLPPKVKLFLAIALPLVANFTIIVAAVHIVLRHRRKRQSQSHPTQDIEAGASSKTPIRATKVDIGAATQALRSKNDEGRG